MILMRLIAFAIMHVGAFLNKVMNETTFAPGIIKKGVGYIRSKNVFLLQEQMSTICPNVRGRIILSRNVN